MSLRETLAGGGGGLPGGLTKDPALLGIFDCTTNVSLYPTGTGTSTQANGANFWGSAGGGIGSVGAVLTTATANTYGTVCNITGKGTLLNVVAPLMAATTDTVSFRITVDDIVTEIIRAGDWSSFSPGGRVVLGPVYMGSNDQYTAAVSYATYYSRSAVFARNRFTVAAGSSISLYQPWKAFAEGYPALHFTKNLKVETKVSALGVDTYAQYSGATYMLLG